MDFGLSKPPEAQHLLLMGSQRMAGEGRCEEKSCSPGTHHWNISESFRERLSRFLVICCHLVSVQHPKTPPAGVTPTRTRAIKRPPQCKVGFDSSIGIPHLLS